MAGIVSTIDFQPFLSGNATEKQATADAIIQSLQNTGFVVLVNHGIAEAKVAGMFDWSKEFFSKPLEIKNLAPHPASGAHHRGFSTVGKEKIIQNNHPGVRNQKTLPSIKESFECGSEANLAMPNIWLPDLILPGFKEACLDFYNECHTAELKILEAIACGLGLIQTHFAEYFTGADNQLRISHYPSVPTRDLDEEKVARISAHSDYGGITLLFQDDIGGLEVEDPAREGVFRPIPPVRGSMVVNVGDLLMRWTNDFLRSTVHRVVAPFDREGLSEMTPVRYSIPYFCAPVSDTLISPLPGTWSDEKPKKYKPVKVGDYVVQRLEETY
ncbi:thymine dioxygenase [Hymenopellis radicata]|nr:thymine dioxygenase [Hymenopellis radicata]